MALTVTAAQSGTGTAEGIALTVKVLTGQAASPIGTTANSITATTPDLAITPAATGSWVYGALANEAAATAFTAASTTTFSQNTADTSNGLTYGTFRSTNTTTASTPVTLGGTAPTETAGDIGIALCEIKALTTLAESGTSPAAVQTSTATSIATASFTPPAGSFLVAMVSSDCAGSSAMSLGVSDTLGLTWTLQSVATLIGGGSSNIQVAAIFTAPVPAASSAPAYVPQNIARGKPAAVRGSGRAGKGAAYVAFPSKFTPPRKPARGAPGAVRGLSRSSPGAVVPAYLFRDEFNGPANSAPNPAYWNVQNGNPGNSSDVAQYIDSTTYAYEDGNSNLCIVTGQVNTGGSGAGRYPSGWVDTFKKFELGANQSLEFSYQINPDGGLQGIWPAVWMMGLNNFTGQPGYDLMNTGTSTYPNPWREVDIVESYGGQYAQPFSPSTNYADSTLWGNAPGAGAPYPITMTTGSGFTADPPGIINLPAPLSGAYNIFRIDCLGSGTTVTGINLYVNNELYGSITAAAANAAQANSWGYDTTGSGGLFLVINSQVDASYLPVNSTLPAVTMKLDYVRAWTPAGPNPNISSSPSPFYPPKGPAKGKTAITGRGHGHPGAPYTAFPSKFTPPKGPAKGASAVRRGAGIPHAGAPVPPPSPFTPPKGPARGAAASVKGRGAGHPGAPYFHVSVFSLPHHPAQGAPAIRRGTAARSAGAKWIAVTHPSVFILPRHPARGAPAAVRGRGTGHAGARFVLRRISPFYAPHRPAQGRAIATRGRGFAGSATGQGAPLTPRQLIVSLASAAGTDDYGNAFPQGILATTGLISGPQFIAFGNQGEVLIYSGTPSLGNLIGSWSGQAGVDPFGNVYPQGLNVTSGSISGTTFMGADFVVSSAGAFFYSGTPAAGNLAVSVAASDGTDSYGNAYLAGQASYSQSGGTYYAVVTAGQALSWYTAGSYAGPWSSLLDVNSYLSDYNSAPTIQLDAPSVVLGSYGACIWSDDGLGSSGAPQFGLPPGGGPFISGEAFQDVSGGVGGVTARVKMLPWNAIWLDVEVTLGSTGTFTLASLPSAAYYPTTSRHFPMASTNASATGARLFVPTFGAIQVVTSGSGAWSGGCSVMYPTN